MLKTADYIYNNILIADNKNTTLKYVKKNQNGVDLSIKQIYSLEEPGTILTDKTYTNKYVPIMARTLHIDDSNAFCEYTTRDFKGWFLKRGTYTVTLNEGIKLGPHDTGFIIHRSSLNRNGVTAMSALFDAGYTTQNKDEIAGMGLRITVDNPYGVFIEQNARIAQLIVFDSEDSGTLYAGQFQGGNDYIDGRV